MRQTIAAVNRRGGGSSPTWGATFIFSTFPIPLNRDPELHCGAPFCAGADGVLSGGASPFQIESKYVGLPPYTRPTAVVLVHGLTGNRTDTWINGTVSFPKMLATDPEFQNKAAARASRFTANKPKDHNPGVGAARVKWSCMTGPVTR